MPFGQMVSALGTLKGQVKSAVNGVIDSKVSNRNTANKLKQAYAFGTGDYADLIKPQMAGGTKVSVSPINSRMQPPATGLQIDGNIGVSNQSAFQRFFNQYGFVTILVGGLLVGAIAIIRNLTPTTKRKTRRTRRGTTKTTSTRGK